MLCCAVLCCAVLCCAVLCCAVLCCAVLCCAVLCCAVLCCTWPDDRVSSALFVRLLFRLFCVSVFVGVFACLLLLLFYVGVDCYGAGTACVSGHSVHPDVGHLQLQGQFYVVFLLLIVRMTSVPLLRTTLAVDVCLSQVNYNGTAMNLPKYVYPTLVLNMNVLIYNGASR